MSPASREKWNLKYATVRATDSLPGPSPLVTDFDAVIPRAGRALDVAGGAGRHALWLARRGLDVTLIDVSDVAVALAGAGDPSPGTLAVERRNLELHPLPEGPWNVILVFYYLQRSLFPSIVERLAPGGWLVYVQPTHRNLERHPRPGPDFLLAEGELRSVFDGPLEIVEYEEGWLGEGRHEARLLARRPGRP